MVSDLEIANAAIVPLGVRPIDAFDDSSRASRLATAQYQIRKRELLVMAFWKFNTRVVLAEQNASAPVNPAYRYSYGIPANTLRVLSLKDSDGNTVDYDLQGLELLANQDQPLYVTIQEDVTSDRFRTRFVAALSAYLEWHWSGPLTSNDNTTAQKEATFTRVFSTAKNRDAFQVPPARLIGRPSQSRLIRARFR